MFDITCAPYMNSVILFENVLYFYQKFSPPLSCSWQLLDNDIKEESTTQSHHPRGLWVSDFELEDPLLKKVLT